MSAHAVTCYSLPSFPLLNFCLRLRMSRGSDSQVLLQLANEPLSLALFHAASGGDFRAVMQMDAKVVPDAVSALHSGVQLKFLNLRCIDPARPGEARATRPDPQGPVNGIDGGCAEPQPRGERQKAHAHTAGHRQRNRANEPQI